MQIRLGSQTCSALLWACFLLAVSVHWQNASALPTKRAVGVSLPLESVPRSYSDDLHPLIRRQQRMNRAYKRFALMTGRAMPSDEELWHNLHRRMLVVSRKRDGTGSSSPEIVLSNDNPEAGNGSVLNDPSGIEPVSNATKPTGPDSLGVDIESNDVGYFTTIQIGSPPRDFRVTIDSGSADFWVQGENCHNDSGEPCAADHAFLTANSSSSLVDTNTPWSIQYGTGDVSGNIVRDNVVISNLTLNNHTFGVAFTESDDFASYATPYDGLLGLALSPLSNQKVITPIEALAKQGLLKEAITSYKIARLADNKHDGVITFGGMDDSKYDPATLVTIPNVSPIGFWEGAIDGFAVDGVDVLLDKNRTGIFDTGTTSILAPEKDAEAIHAAIAGAQSDGEGGFTMPCDSNVTVSLTIGGRSFSIDPRDLVDGPVDENDPESDCASNISSDTSIINGPSEWLLGDTFLKNVYMSTNADKNTVTLANLV